MAFLAPLAAGAGATAGATALATAAGTATATGALGAGLTLGTSLGAGVGLKAGAGLLAPTLGATLPGVVSAGGAGLAGLGGIGLKAGAGLLAPGLGAALPGAIPAGGAGLASLGGAGPLMPKFASLNAPLTVNPFSAVNQATGLGNLGTQAGNLAPELIKTSTAVKDAAIFDPSKGLLGNAPKISSLKAPTGTNYLTEGAKSMTDLPSVQNYLTQMPGEAGRVGLKMVPPGAETTGLRLAPEAAQSMLAPKGSPIVKGEGFLSNLGNLVKNPSLDAAGDYIKEHPYASAGAAYMAYDALKPKPQPPKEQDKGMIRPYEFEYNPNTAAYETSPVADSSERMYFSPKFTALEPVKAAEGGIMALAVGGPVETMSAMNAVGGNLMYPQSQLQTPLYSNPLVQRPEAVNVISPSGEPAVGAYSGEAKFASGGDTKEPKTEGQYTYAYDPKTLTFTQLTTPRYADNVSKNTPPLNTGAKTVGGIASPVGGPGIAALMPQTQAAPLNIPAYQSPEERFGLTDFYAMMNRRLGEMGGYAAGGGISDLGGYSDGGRLLKGPGDGVSDSIPAVIGERQPARLADGEFVIPARIVSELGNGSTEAGARKLYAMMDRVQKARGKTVGKDRVAANTKADKHLPA